MAAKPKKSAPKKTDASKAKETHERRPPKTTYGLRTPPGRSPQPDPNEDVTLDKKHKEVIKAMRELDKTGRTAFYLDEIAEAAGLGRASTKTVLDALATPTYVVAVTTYYSLTQVPGRTGNVNSPELGTNEREVIEAMRRLELNTNPKRSCFERHEIAKEANNMNPTTAGTTLRSLATPPPNPTWVKTCT